MQLIKEAAFYVNDEELELDVDDVGELINDMVPPLLSTVNASGTQSEADSPGETPTSVIEMLRNGQNTEE